MDPSVIATGTLIDLTTFTSDLIRNPHSILVQPHAVRIAERRPRFEFTGSLRKGFRNINFTNTDVWQVTHRRIT